ncbi:hypothetical protein JB92DRAFT_1710416 [Gautieria morchelliformis]|nr:hypothetical protein JB92DRAFT_1710416 [Gautieria morchelliformis]
MILESTRDVSEKYTVYVETVATGFGAEQDLGWNGVERWRQVNSAILVGGGPVHTRQPCNPPLPPQLQLTVVACDSLPHQVNSYGEENRISTRPPVHAALVPFPVSVPNTKLAARGIAPPILREPRARNRLHPFNMTLISANHSLPFMIANATLFPGRRAISVAQSKCGADLKPSSTKGCVTLLKLTLMMPGTSYPSSSGLVDHLVS